MQMGWKKAFAWNVIFFNRIEIERKFRVMRHTAPSSAHVQAFAAHVAGLKAHCLANSPTGRHRTNAFVCTVRRIQHYPHWPNAWGGEIAKSVHRLSVYIQQHFIHCMNHRQKLSGWNITPATRAHSVASGELNFQHGQPYGVRTARGCTNEQIAKRTMRTRISK